MKQKCFIIILIRSLVGESERMSAPVSELAAARTKLDVVYSSIDDIEKSGLYNRFCPPATLPSPRSVLAATLSRLHQVSLPN